MIETKATNDSDGARSTYVNAQIREKEVEFAEIELRLRRMVLELLQPSVKKTKELDYLVEELRNSSKTVEQQIREIMVDTSVTKNRVASIDCFYEMLDAEAKARQLTDKQLEDKIIAVSSDVEFKLMNTVEKDDKIQRKMEELEANLAKMETTNSTCFVELETKITDINRQTLQAQQDHDVRIGEQEIELSNLNLKIFGSDGLSRQLQTDQKMIRTEVDSIQKTIAIVSARALRTSDLEDTIDSLREQLTDFETDQNELSNNMTSMFQNLRDDIALKNSQAAARTATYMQKMRKEYQMELLENKGIREGIEQWKYQARTGNDEIKKEVDRMALRTEECLRIARIDIDQLLANSEIVKLKVEVDENTQRAYEKAERAFNGTQSLAEATTHITSVIKILLEATKLNFQMDDGLLDKMVKDKIMNKNILDGDSIVKVLKELRWSMINQASMALNEGPAKKTRLPTVYKPANGSQAHNDPFPGLQKSAPVSAR